MTVLRNTDIIKLASVDPLVDTASPYSAIARGSEHIRWRDSPELVMLKPEFEDGGEVISSIPTHSPLIQASQPSRPASSDKPAELSLEQDGLRLQPEPSSSPYSSTVHTATSHPKQSSLLDTD